MSRTLASVCLGALIAVSLVACGGAGDSTSTDAVERTDPPVPGFEDTSGVTDIPAFGFEATADQRGQAEISLNAYLGEIGARRWQRACASLATPSRKELLTLIAQAEDVKERNCGEALRLSLAGRNPYTARAEVAALRIKTGDLAGDGAGFALFHGRDGSDYWVTMRSEGGSWRVSAIQPQELR